VRDSFIGITHFYYYFSEDKQFFMRKITFE